MCRSHFIFHFYFYFSAKVPGKDNRARVRHDARRWPVCPFSTTLYFLLSPKLRRRRVSSHSVSIDIWRVDCLLSCSLDLFPSCGVRMNSCLVHTARIVWGERGTHFDASSSLSAMRYCCYFCWCSRSWVLSSPRVCGCAGAVKIRDTHWLRGSARERERDGTQVNTHMRTHTHTRPHTTR